MTAQINCRAGCGACCIAPSITSPIPGMPLGKKAGERCIQLDTENKCKIFGDPLRPEVCSAFTADPDICGTTREHAIRVLNLLEQDTGLKPEIKSVL